MKKILTIDNPTNLPLIPLDDLHDFQEDLKQEPTRDSLQRLMRSIIDHHLFLGKAIFYEDGIAYTEDGHQTLKALRELHKLGYTSCDVITYELKDGRMVPADKMHYENVYVPVQVIVPVGKTREARMKDAAAKLLQINSRYAEFNPATSFFDSLGFSDDDLDSVLAQVQVPDLHLSGSEESPLSEFEQEMEGYDNSNCIYPIVRRFSEKHSAIIIVVDDEIDEASILTNLEIGKEQSYRSTNFGQSHVISSSKFLELWNKRNEH